MDIGFLPFSIFDALDIVIVGYLIYLMYRLLRGSVAINVFVGVVLLLIVSYLVKSLNMQMLSAILGAVISTGVVILIILFQPEIRRFLLALSDNALGGRVNFLTRFFYPEEEENEYKQAWVMEVNKAIVTLSQRKEGALIVLGGDVNLDNIANTGVSLHADISRPLIENIFAKNTPLHDGAVLLSKDKIVAASCILPVSDSRKLPQKAGLRHRAAVGITERLQVVALIVSEETGMISYSKNGKLYRKISHEKLLKVIDKNW